MFEKILCVHCDRHSDASRRRICKIEEMSDHRVAVCDPEESIAWYRTFIAAGMNASEYPDLVIIDLDSGMDVWNLVERLGNLFTDQPAMPKVEIFTTATGRGEDRGEEKTTGQHPAIFPVFKKELSMELLNDKTKWN